VEEMEDFLACERGRGFSPISKISLCIPVGEQERKGKRPGKERAAAVRWQKSQGKKREGEGGGEGVEKRKGYRYREG